MKFIGAFWLTLVACFAANYFPPSDDAGGWRTLPNAAEIRRVTDIDVAQLDAAFALIQGSTKNGGLLIVRHGWLVYERYFGLGHRDATPNLASCGKSFTSIAVGMLMAERPELFPDGLDQKIFTPKYFPPDAFPLSDPRKAEIKLGQLLAFTAGIRGNNPSYVNGRATQINPVGPDGWYAKVQDYALGRSDGKMGQTPFSTATLWCEPGAGYSYASASIHLASVMLRHVAGMELQAYLEDHLAKPLGWGRWGFGYKDQPEVEHTPGGGGIALRATDMLRFGYMLLHEGRWGERQLVPADYVQRCARQSPYNPHYPYSLQFNVNTRGEIPELPRDAFWKLGSGGHVLYVVPSLDLVVWKLGGRDDQYSPANTGLPASPAPREQIAARQGWKASESVDAATAARITLQRVIAAITPGKTTLTSIPTKPATLHPTPDLSSITLQAPPDSLRLNLMMDGRLAWFSWMNQPRLRPKLVAEWNVGGKTFTKEWQHGTDGSEWPQTIFLLRGDEPGQVRWGGHAELGAGRDGHKHHFFAKDSPPRVAFLKADLSEIPRDAVITRVELVLHIHDSEGLKAGDSEEAAGVGRFRHVNKDWDWDHVTFTHYAAGKPWTTPTKEYPFLGEDDVSPVLWSLNRQRDLAARGYHKNGIRDYPLDLTAYAARLQQLRKPSPAGKP
jgi:CubicO group peptidase (beta-lactamase class C family)